MKKIILSLDTSLNYCSVALLVDNCIDSLFEKCKQNQTKVILPMIKKILNRNLIDLNEINLIGVTHGPGELTGIRTGICVAKSISIIKKIPLISVSTISILAEQSKRLHLLNKVLVFMNFNKNKIFLGKYSINNTNGIFELNGKERVLRNSNFDIKKLNLDNEWTIIGNMFKKENSKRNKKIKFIKISVPNAIDIIPFANFFYKKKHIFKNINNIKTSYLF
ncbi:MAG: tRNA (adenosine(37)-N6)-threonylcarbamoyltransferase complex dimerization subunit type 1 TsaB [Buchnera aphidicola (Tetraneura sorini)]